MFESLLEKIASELDKSGIPYMVIGGVGCIHFRDMLPKSKVGKKLRREIREEERKNSRPEIQSSTFRAKAPPHRMCLTDYIVVISSDDAISGNLLPAKP